MPGAVSRSVASTHDRASREPRSPVRRSGTASRAVRSRRPPRRLGSARCPETPSRRRLSGSDLARRVGSESSRARDVMKRVAFGDLLLSPQLAFLQAVYGDRPPKSRRADRHVSAVFVRTCAQRSASLFRRRERPRVRAVGATWRFSNHRCMSTRRLRVGRWPCTINNDLSGVWDGLSWKAPVRRSEPRAEGKAARWIPLQDLLGSVPPCDKPMRPLTLSVVAYADEPNRGLR